MSGYRSGSSQSLSIRAFNERAKALSAQLGPVEKSAKEPRAGQGRRQNFKFGARSEPVQPTEPTEQAAPAETTEPSAEE